ncbi:hypothetical protein B0H15DRAFT_452307 [Mycena belliarum]|uniref:Uncharacterized protein n=1 Tax=Mycena belliarum TaxID=1033014 RepID=A0AAD6XKT3_9AGAR|nr:hypothetical protein B0H15DRAFT_452307 [Mycena belliae]
MTTHICSTRARYGASRRRRRLLERPRSSLVQISISGSAMEAQAHTLANQVRQPRACSGTPARRPSTAINQSMALISAEREGGRGDTLFPTYSVGWIDSPAAQMTSCVTYGRTVSRPKTVAMSATSMFENGTIREQWTQPRTRRCRRKREDGGWRHVRLTAAGSSAWVPGSASRSRCRGVTIMQRALRAVQAWCELERWDGTVYIMRWWW